MYSIKILNLSYDIYVGVSIRIWSDCKPTQCRKRNSQYQLVSMYCHVLYTYFYYRTTRFISISNLQYHRAQFLRYRYITAFRLSNYLRRCITTLYNAMMLRQRREIRQNSNTHRIPQSQYTKDQVCDEVIIRFDNH